jgi:organic hydroperoxide reductase OsmC/OhrA
MRREFMNEKTCVSEIKTKFKSFNYQTELLWIGHRAAMIHSEGKPPFRVASPPEFKGEAGVWTPEDLFVASVETCTMTTFLAFAEKKNLPIISYTSYAEGLMENVDGNYQFTRIILRPKIEISSDTSEELVRTTLEDSHKKCFIANSIRADVILEPEIIYQLIALC